MIVDLLVEPVVGSGFPVACQGNGFAPGLLWTADNAVRCGFRVPTGFLAGADARLVVGVNAGIGVSGTFGYILQYGGNTESGEVSFVGNDGVQEIEIVFDSGMVAGAIVENDQDLAFTVVLNDITGTSFETWYFRFVYGDQLALDPAGQYPEPLARVIRGVRSLCWSVEDVLQDRDVVRLINVALLGLSSKGIFRTVGSVDLPADSASVSFAALVPAVARIRSVVWDRGDGFANKAVPIVNQDMMEVGRYSVEYSLGPAMCSVNGTTLFVTPACGGTGESLRISYEYVPTAFSDVDSDLVYSNWLMTYLVYETAALVRMSWRGKYEGGEVLTFRNIAEANLLHLVRQLEGPSGFILPRPVAARLR